MPAAVLAVRGARPSETTAPTAQHARAPHAADGAATYEVRPGTKIKGKWEVAEKLGQGGCGAVYMLKPLKKPAAAPSAAGAKDKTSMIPREEADYLDGVAPAAMKVEPNSAGPKAVLKMEVFVLQCVGKKPHIPELYSMGKTHHYSFMVMQLLGRTLQELRTDTPRRHFTLATTVRVGRQCLDAIESLHNSGFVHRDIKPANFATGYGQKDQRTIYIIDFGLARKLLDGKGEVRAPRQRANFRGTFRYCSPNVHRRLEQGRNDDLYSWMYMLIELVSGLPWANLKSREEIAFAKTAVTDEELFGGDRCPREFRALMGFVRALEYNDAPKYAQMRDTLDAISRRKGYKEEDPMDWEEGGRYFEHTRRGVEHNVCIDEDELLVRDGDDSAHEPVTHPTQPLKDKHDKDKHDKDKHDKDKHDKDKHDVTQD